MASILTKEIWKEVYCFWNCFKKGRIIYPPVKI